MRIASTQGRARAGGRAGLILACGIFVAVLAGWLAFSYLRSAAPSVAVLVAAHDVAPYSPVQPGDFTLETRPRASLPADALTDTGATAGLITKGTLLKGDLVRAGHLSRQTGSALSATLARTPDLRIINLTPDAVDGFQGQLSPGDHVDVLGVMQVSNGKTNEARVGTLAAGAAIVAVSSVQKDGGLGGTSGGSVLISATPAQAQAIRLAQATGKVFVQLSLAEQKGGAPPVMTPETVLGGLAR